LGLNYTIEDNGDKGCDSCAVSCYCNNDNDNDNYKDINCCMAPKNHIYINIILIRWLKRKKMLIKGVNR